MPFGIWTRMSKCTDSVKSAALAAHDISITKPLGEGAFSVVYKGTIKIDGKPKPCAVKCYTNQFTNLSDAQIRQLAAQETKLCAQFKHPNVIETYAFVCDAQVVCSCMELSKGDLFETIVPGRGLPATRMISVLRDICNGLRYLHEEARLVHLDVKAENILVTKDGTAKLADFDTCVPVGSIQQTPRGTADFHPPELLQAYRAATGGFVINPCVDVWSVGILTFLLARGKYPWDLATVTDAKYAEYLRQQRSGGDSGCSWEKIPQSVQSLLSKCWSIVPADRPQAGDIVDLLDDDLEADMARDKGEKPRVMKPKLARGVRGFLSTKKKKALIR
eukprot:m.121090 g.121090  ORF g.121090 m.121090 type:complete len:333 (-) comp17264_c0_seq1:239-1237(-)